MIFYDRAIIKGVKATLDELNIKVEIHLESASNREFIVSSQWDYVIADFNKDQTPNIVDALDSITLVYSNHLLSNIPANLSSVTLDNAGLANTALKGLEGGNIKQVGYFASQQDHSHLWSKEREFAFNHSAKSANMSVLGDIESTIRQRQFPIGVYCSSDRSARRLVNLCNEYGADIPNDVAIIGTDFDDTERLLSSMPLTSVELDPYELGCLCAKTLYRVIKYKRRHHAVFSSYKLVQGYTTAMQANIDESLIKAEVYIRNHYHLNIKIKQVIDHCRISRKTLDARFMSAHGVTAHQYLTQYRLQKARLLLLNSADNLDSIAKQVGYPGQSYFSQVFSKYYDEAPSQFRLLGDK